ncbi:hypothetical protein COEREDRAFT_11575 [Coemansia reversa NRRL 1564]|uniref:Uncharacterized protein n=1 Tax=Coemansia reversa (strain ATCC 12441 / NRRL 1564) TaxID=763665 RepID=A0A2G5B2R2_COERN|nr:hypothetical protein COEREDRAFT_11575 [Coemansia reversa NRRL 1564]|eukprot:PIA13284.1 hypothetical protein COEREDRAFT_11575 [Coemansia reversa NRRL 1564]
MENDGNVEQDQVVQIPVLTPAAEEPVTRQYEGSVAPLHLARAWSTWHMQHPMERINGWAGFAAYIHLHHNSQNTRRGLALQLLQLSDEGHSILSFNDEFCRLYQALGEELGDVAIAMYTSYLPVSLHIVVFSLGPDATLDTAMQVVAAHVEAVCQAEVSGGAIEIDAPGFGTFVLKQPPIVITDPAGCELGWTIHHIHIDMVFADGMQILTEFYVVPIALDAIIAIPWLQHWNMQIDTRDKCVTLDVVGRMVCLPCVPFGQLHSDAFGVHLVTCEELEELEAADEIEFIGLVSASTDGLKINAIHMVDSMVSGGSRFKKKLLSEFTNVFGEPLAGLPPKCFVDHRIVLADGA